MKKIIYKIKSRIVYLILLLFCFGFIYYFFRFRELLLLTAVIVISQVVMLFLSRKHLVVITQGLSCFLLIFFVSGYYMCKEVESTYNSYLKIKKEALSNNISSEQNKSVLYQWRKRKSENNQSLSLAVLGDIHFPLCKPINAVLDLIDQAGTVDFVLCPGDLTENSSYSNMYLLKKWMMKYMFPVLYVPGDHDDILHYKKLVKNENWNITFARHVGERTQRVFGRFAER